MKRKAFTLIEMLVVIGIISILASILFPVLMGVKSKVQQTKCAVQLKQLGMSIQMYSNDHDDAPPIGGYDVMQIVPPATKPTLVRINWKDTLVDNVYLKTKEILLCPAVATDDSRYSYGANRWVMGWRSACKMSSIPYPSDTILATEKVGYDWVAWEPTESRNPFFQPLDPRHSNQLNVLFTDGHVKKIAVGELIIGNKAIWRW